MLRVNQKLSGVVSGVGMNKLRVIVDGETREEAESTAARELASQISAENGYANGGLCETPQVGPIGADGDVLEDVSALEPGIEVIGFRVEFTFANRA
jgi:hypothetical protein